MPLFILPLALNFRLVGSVWMCEMSLTLQITLTVITVLKFAIAFSAVLIIETDWLKIAGYIVCNLLNVLLIVMGVIYGSPGMIASASLLILSFVVWRVLPSICVKQEKEGSKQ